MAEIVRKTVYVPPEHQDMWADLEALAAIQGRPYAHLVNQALAEFALLGAYRAGKDHQVAVLASR